ncbi:MAG TPA: selenide, water dikinase SelD [Candidatus Limnocylindrales bacterium]
MTAPTTDASDRASLPLTEQTDCGGCAAKLGADLLADALAGLGAGAAATPDALLIGLDAPDDAAVYRLTDDLAVVGTLDFFPPLVDDPEAFGAIAAANAMSDVYAMGGRVLFALSIAAFPEALPSETMSAIFAGAAATVREGGGVLAGGHTIKDPEPKYGLAVVGVVHPDHVMRKGGARPGDVLLLTKPLGTGVLVSGDRSGRTSAEHLEGAVRSMRRLNRAASEVLAESGVVAATDVTGFGLLGHATEMARASGTRFVIEAGQLPALDGALDLAAAGVETGGAAHNRRFAAPTLTIGDGVDRAREILAFDPQTSGGLMAAVPNDRVATVVAGFGAIGVGWWRVGRVEAGEPGVELVS